MKRTVIRLFLWVNLLFVVIIYLSGCSATKPNTPFAGPYPQSFNDLSAKNPLLANELAKLPEFQDGISNDENKALEKIVTLYNENQRAFDMAFQEMYQVGKPEVRKYCSPLQALFWLVEDGKEATINTTLEAYSPYGLIARAWVFDKSGETEPYIKVLQMTEEQIQLIITKLSKEDQEFYEGMSTKLINLGLLIQYKDNPRYFPREIRKTIESSLKKIPNKNYKNYIRWKDFNTVMDRLNAPNLVDYYIKSNISYKRGYTQTPYRTFKRKIGQCLCLTYFGTKALKQAGYKTFKRHVAWGPWGTHDHGGGGIIMNDGRYLLVIDFSYANNMMSGPYTNILDVDNQLAHGNKIRARMWGTYFPPR